MRGIRRTALLVLVLAVVAWREPSPMPAPCDLLTVQDAKTLLGFDVTLNRQTARNCSYTRTGQAPSMDVPDGVELKVLAMESDDAAHAKFPSWAYPGGRTQPTRTVTDMSGVGDEAVTTHTNDAGSKNDLKISAICLRKGAVLVSIGTHPQVTDAALKIAAAAVLSRLSK